MKNKEADDKTKLGTRYSAPYFQRKYKLTYEMANTFMSILKDLEMQSIWYDPLSRLPSQMTPVIVEGKPHKLTEDCKFEFHLAYIDGRCGWVNRDTHELLYVVKWMEIPGEKQKKTKNDTMEFEEKVKNSKDK